MPELSESNTKYAFSDKIGGCINGRPTITHERRQPC